MSPTKSTPPLRVIASVTDWKLGDGRTRPVVRVAGPRGTIYIGRDDLDALQNAVQSARDLNANIDAAEQAQAVAS